MQDSGATSRQIQWQRRLNRWLYDSLAPLYDSMDWLTFGAWWRLVRRALEYAPTGGDVLEIGFGPGKLHLELVRRDPCIFGLDLARSMCRITQKRLLHSGRSARLTQGDALALPFAGASFDAVVSTFTFSGLPDGERAAREVARVLRPSGRLVMVDIGLPSDENIIGTLLARLWERVGDVLYDQPALMRTAGLDIDVFDEFGPGNHIRLIIAHLPS